MQGRYALIDTGLNEIVNVIVWDPDTSAWQPPGGSIMVMIDDGWGFGPGDLYDPITGGFERAVSIEEVAE